MIIEEVVDSEDGPVGVVFELTMKHAEHQTEPGAVLLDCQTRVLATYRFRPGPDLDAPDIGEPKR